MEGYYLLAGVPGHNCEQSRPHRIREFKVGRLGQWLVMLIPYLAANKAGHVNHGLIQAGLQNRLQWCRVKNLLIPSRPRSQGP